MRELNVVLGLERGVVGGVEMTAVSSSFGSVGEDATEVGSSSCIVAEEEVVEVEEQPTRQG